MSIYLEQYEPDVMANGLNSIKNADFSGASSVALPAGTTIGGSSVVALASISGSITTGASLSITTTGVYTGTGVVPIVADSATTGSIFTVSGAGLTTGHAATITAAGTITTTGDALSVIANSATTSTGVVRVSTTGLTTGNALKIAATAATLTTGRYISVNDTTTGEVFGVGTNGHIISTASASVPTISPTTQNGITAAAITAGGSDTCGVITTTGTSTGSTVITVTFGKTYTTAPKYIHVGAANAAAAALNTGWYVNSISATQFTLTVAAAGTYAATPSWYYMVIA